jgi:Tol biopolymer transport system component
MRRLLPVAAVALLLTAGAQAASSKRYACLPTPSSAWSPNGHQIAFGSRPICIESVRGSDPRRIFVGGDGVDQLAWSSEHRMYFSANGSLFSIDPAERRLTTVAGAISDPSFSLDRRGTRAAYGCSGDPHSAQPVTVLDLPTRKQTLIGGSIYDNCSPTLSPDGRRVAFERIAGRDGDWSFGRGIWVASSNGSSLRRITSGGGNPVWSPQGGEIAYWIGSPPGPPGWGKLMLVAPARGTSRTILAHGVQRLLPNSWSPNGKLIAFIDKRGGLSLVSPSSGSVRGLPWLGYVGGIAWSPDSRQFLMNAGTLHPACATLWRFELSSGRHFRIVRHCAAK